ncbi:MAG: fluoride efflux transporter CrcB [Desulfobacteraceae bacterium]|nr:fluoride efflux transporter CrcB [Desulfobacteraceae bacterium]
MKSIFLIGIGGFIGSIMRYIIYIWSQSLFKELSFPLGTLIVNITGCLLLGLLNGWAENYQFFTLQIRLFLFVGLLGSFTTFSTFAYQTIEMIQNGHPYQALLNITIQVIVGLLAAFIGFQIAYRS